MAHKKGCSPGFWEDSSARTGVGNDQNQTIGSVFTAPAPFHTETLSRAWTVAAAPT